jgi:hypothetical protein
MRFALTGSSTLHSLSGAKRLMIGFGDPLIDAAVGAKYEVSFTQIVLAIMIPIFLLVEQSSPQEEPEEF